MGESAVATEPAAKAARDEALTAGGWGAVVLKGEAAAERQA